MPPLSRQHLVIGPFTLKGLKLTFQTDNVLLVSDARRAKETNADFTVTLSQPEGLKMVTGRVSSIDVVPGIARPQYWEVTMTRVGERE